MQLVTELTPVDINDIKEMAKDARGEILRVFLHWTAGHYGQVYDDYHISIDYDGRIYLPDDCRDLTQRREHTYQRNYRSVGVTVCGCYGAEANNGYDAYMGKEPVTEAQVEVLAIVVATLVKHAGLSLSDVYTHCEIALADGYGPYQGDPETRWDLWYLRDSDGAMKPGGEVIRGKAQWYLNHYDI